MTEPFSSADRDACARDALTAIEVVLDRLSPEARSAFWVAVDKLYRSKAEADGPQPG